MHINSPGATVHNAAMASGSYIDASSSVPPPPPEWMRVLGYVAGVIFLAWSLWYMGNVVMRFRSFAQVREGQDEGADVADDPAGSAANDTTEKEYVMVTHCDAVDRASCRAGNDGIDDNETDDCINAPVVEEVSLETRKSE